MPPVVARLGPRQCGNTTVARQLVAVGLANSFELEDAAGLLGLSGLVQDFLRLERLDAGFDRGIEGGFPRPAGSDGLTAEVGAAGERIDGVVVDRTADRREYGVT